MKQKHFHLLNDLIACAVVSLVAMATGTSVSAQKAAPQRDMSSAERNVRAMEIGSGSPRDAKTIMTEVNEDFARIRVINEDIKMVSSTNGPLNYKSLLDTSVEIKKRATRLKTNLAGLPKIETDEKRRRENVPLDEAQMKVLLSSLNGVMTSFLTNPVFSDMGTLDNQLALKARRDLDSLIDLSEVIKKGADKLARTSTKSTPKPN
jgi:hypothetical protein